MEIYKNAFQRAFIILKCLSTHRLFLSQQNKKKLKYTFESIKYEFHTLYYDLV